MTVLKRLVLVVVTLGVLGVLGFGALAYWPEIRPISPPPPTGFDSGLVTRGEALSGGGFCAECHTAKGGKTFAGGYPMPTPFGVIYSTNITPDPETGIGTWSEAAFTRAMREGVSRDGSHLFPAFPYDHYTKLSDDDVQALYAYFMTRAPVRAPARQNELPFPLSIRYLQAGWKLLFFSPGRFEPDASKPAEWNRGAYLALGLSHCGGCHTPRNSFGAEKAGNPYGGAVIDNWIAPPLTAENPSPVPWTQEEIYSYLYSGASALHGIAAGPMSPIVHGLDALPASDIQAIAVYFADIDHAGDHLASIQPAVARAMSYAPIGTGLVFDTDTRFYLAACASCHYNSGHPLAVRPELALTSALTLSDPTNLIQVVLRGVNANEGIPGVVMPSFAQGFSDSDIARIAAYLRRTRTNLPPWTDLEKKVTAIHAQIGVSP